VTGKGVIEGANVTDVLAIVDEENVVLILFRKARELFFVCHFLYFEILTICCALKGLLGCLIVWSVGTCEQKYVLVGQSTAITIYFT